MWEEGSDVTLMSQDASGFKFQRHRTANPQITVVYDYNKSKDDK